MATWLEFTYGLVTDRENWIMLGSMPLSQS